MTITELHVKSLAAFVNRRFYSVAEAARHVRLSRAKVSELLNIQPIESEYCGPKLRNVVVHSLFEFADSKPNDRPEST